VRSRVESGRGSGEASTPRWNEKAGSQRDALSSQGYALEVQKETGHEEE
jgi:hypothetical protein